MRSGGRLRAGERLLLPHEASQLLRSSLTIGSARARTLMATERANIGWLSATLRVLRGILNPVTHCLSCPGRGVPGTCSNMLVQSDRDTA